jgi:predicted permease
VTRGWRRLLRLRFGRAERDVDDEVRFHLAERAADLEALGESTEAARARALEEFGDVEAVRAELVEIDRGVESKRRRADRWEGVAQDARHVARGLLRTPGFTVMVIVTLALGIGANAVVFSLIDRLFFQPPAGVPHPERVRRIAQRYTRQITHESVARGVYNYPEVRAVTEAAPPGISIAAYTSADELPLGREAGALKVVATRVVGDYFGALGVRPEAGRFFTPEEQAPSGLTPVAVISHRLWERRFGGSHEVLGQDIEVGRHRYTIVGVAPEHFEGVSLDATELWLPFNTMGGWTTRKADWYEAPYTLYLRMVAHVPSTAAATALVTRATGVLRESAVMHDSTAVALLAPLDGAIDSEFHSGEFAISRRLVGVAVMIFLIACANVANLLLVRALGRRRETAVRIALGVSRRRLAAQFMSEAMLLAVVGGAAALLVTWWGGALLRRSILPSVQWGNDGISLRVILFAMLATLAAGVVAGIVPAIQGGNPQLATALRGGAREGRTTRGRTRTTLLIVQAALSVVLLAGAALFIRSLRAVEAIDLGYDDGQLIFASASPAMEDSTARRRIARELPTIADRLTHLPDVERATVAPIAPMYGISFQKMFIPGIDSLASIGPFGMPVMAYISPDYFATVGMSIRRGRSFTGSDREGTELVAVVNEKMARSYWPNGDAIGSCIMVEQRAAPCRRIVGVVSDAHINAIVEEPAPAYYLPLAQASEEWKGVGTIVVRARAGRVASANAAVTRELRSAIGSFATIEVRPMDATLSHQLHQWRLGAALFSVAGTLALLVAAVGIYSTVAYMTSQRTHEIGVRIALGARSGNIARVVVARGVGIVAAGITVGVLAALAMGGLVASLLYGITPHDPLVLGSVALALLVVAVAACLIPAWRATRVDPMETLRTE